MQVANDAAAALYGYGYTDVLFKPTKAAEYPFRPTATGALSYFVGGDNVEGGYLEDKGFAHNVGQGWSEVRFENVQIDLIDDMALAMGHYIFTQATGEGAGKLYSLSRKVCKSFFFPTMIHSFFLENLMSGIFLAPVRFSSRK